MVGLLVPLRLFPRLHVAARSVRRRASRHGTAAAADAAARGLQLRAERGGHLGGQRRYRRRQAARDQPSGVPRRGSASAGAGVAAGIETKTH